MDVVKKIWFSLILLSVLACSRPASKTITEIAQKTSVEKCIPFNDAKYFPDEEHFRAIQIGHDASLVKANKIAMLNAQAELASSVEVLIESATESYTKPLPIETAIVFEEKIKSIVKQRLQHWKVIGKDYCEERNGSFTAWVAIEMDRNQLQSSIKEDLKTVLKEEHQFQEKRFEKLLDQKISTLDNQLEKRDSLFRVYLKNLKAWNKKNPRKKTIANPVKEVIKSKRLSIPIANGQYTITSKWGERIHPVFRKKIFFEGIDFSCSKGTKVLAADNGIVLKTGFLEGYGNYIQIEHSQDLITVYAHMKKVSVVEKQKVERGATIGEVGKSGNAISPKLYFETIYKQRKRNPALFFKN